MQFLRAAEIITRRLTEEEPGFVSLVTIFEVVWVLKSLYRRSRQDIANDIEMLLAADTLEIQNEQEVSGQGDGTRLLSRKRRRPSGLQNTNCEQRFGRS